MRLEFTNYFDLDSELLIINQNKNISAPQIAEQIALIFLKIISYITILAPIICAFGMLFQAKPLIEQTDQKEAPPLNRSATETDQSLQAAKAEEQEQAEAETGVETGVETGAEGQGQVPAPVPATVPAPPIDPWLAIFDQLSDGELESLYVEHTKSDQYETIIDPTWIYFDTNIVHLTDEQSGRFHSAKSDDLKFHISIERNLENFKSGINIVMDVLCRYNISSFKLSNPKCRQAWKESSNANGKEFCVYFQTFERDAMEKVACEINQALEKASIVKGRPSKGDILAPDCTYIYYRSPNNVFNNYVKAEDLQQAGFTRLESAGISCPKWRPEDPSIWEVTLKTPAPHQFSDSRVGNEKYKEKIQCQIDKNFNECTYKILGYDSYSSIVVHSNIHNGIFKDSKIFQKIIDISSNRIALIFEEMNLPPDQTIGSVFPAIYYTIIAPLNRVLSWHDKRQEDFDSYLEEHQEEIFNYIVDCALRDPSKSQFDSDTPVYLQKQN